MQHIQGAMISVINDWYGMICVLSPFVILGYVMLLLEKKSEKLEDDNKKELRTDKTA